MDTYYPYLHQGQPGHKAQGVGFRVWGSWTRVRSVCKLASWEEQLMMLQEGLKLQPYDKSD